MTSTPFASSTSSALAKAGSLSACVSLARNSGPLVPSPLRYSQIACEMARMWFSLNEVCSDDPRCPEVPNATFCVGSETSGFSS